MPTSAAGSRVCLQPSAKVPLSEPFPRCGEVKMRAFPSLIGFPRALKPPRVGIGEGGQEVPLPVRCRASRLSWGCFLGSRPPRPSWLDPLGFGVESCSCVGHGEQHRNCLKPNLLFSVVLHRFLFFFLSFGFFYFVTLSACFGIGVMNQNSVAKQSSLHYSVAFATEIGCISQKGLVLLTAGQS